MDRRLLIPFCGVLLAFNAFSCDIVLPAFFEIERDLGVSIERVQAIVPVFLMAAGCAQLFFGPLSDRFGRRPVLLAGLTFYIAGSVLALTTASLMLLYVSRILQGIGAACGVVTARAILRDTHNGVELARAMSLAMTIFAIGPLTAPLLGAAVMHIAGWRGTFAVMAVFGCAVALAGLFFLKETHPSPDPGALGVGQIKSAFRTVLEHPQSRYFLGISIVLQFTVTSLVMNAPRLFKSAFEVDGGAFAMAFSFTAFGVIMGQLAARQLVSRFGMVGTAQTAAAIFLANAVVMALATFAGIMSAPRFVLHLVIFSASFLVVMTNCISLFLDPHREIAGTASSVYGFLTQLTGSVLAVVLLPLTAGQLRPWVVLQVALGMMVLALVSHYRRSAGAKAGAADFGS